MFMESRCRADRDIEHGHGGDTPNFVPLGSAKSFLAYAIAGSIAPMIWALNWYDGTVIGPHRRRYELWCARRPIVGVKGVGWLLCVVAGLQSGKGVVLLCCAPPQHVQIVQRNCWQHE